MSDKKILIFAETDCGRVIPACFELLSKAGELRHSLEQILGSAVEICAVAAGYPGDDAVSSLEASGADTVYILDHPELENYNPAIFCDAIEWLCRRLEPYIFLFGATSMGTELAPALGIRLNTGVAAHCVELRIDKEGDLIQEVPAFGGKVIGEILTPGRAPKIATVKPGIFQPAERLDSSANLCRLQPVLPGGRGDGVQLQKVHLKPQNSLPVEKAETVICGGFGIGCSENWELLEKVAGYFENSAVGCTRPALDEDWAEDENTMIGTSGKTVRPRLYIGAGISGAMHHVCGIGDSEFIVSINRDENADIFRVSDIKIIGDAAEILSALERRLSEEL